MSDLDKRISDALENGAKYLVMGEIAAHTGLLVSPAPLEDTDYDIIANNIDLSKGCMVKVVHSRDKFEGDIKGSDYDFLVFVYAPSIIENGIIRPKYGRATDKHAGTDNKRGMYIFPKDVIRSAIEGKSGASFDPKELKTDGTVDKEKYKEYRNAFHLITALVPNSPADFNP